jgi:hypothetical protein
MPALTVELVTRKPTVDRAEELAVEARFVNASGDTVRLNTAQAENPSLALEVQGPSEQPVLLPPPGPPSDRELGPGDPIDPGESIALDYRNFLDPMLGPGTFRVRYVGRVPELGGLPDDPLMSGWLEFELPRPPQLPKPWGRLWPIRYLWDWLRRLIEIILGWFRKCRRVWEQEVDEQVTETISNAPPGQEAWNGTYAWRARFLLRIDQSTCRVRVTVRVRVTGTITAAQLSGWETAIQTAWSDIFKLCCGGKCCAQGYRIVADIQFVTSGEHQVVMAGASTVNMGLWGASDTADVDHEFGHMLGAPDEYFTVNGTDWGPGRQPGAPIMNNPANPPVARNYELIRTRAQALMGGACTTKAVTDPC